MRVISEDSVRTVHSMSDNCARTGGEMQVTRGSQGTAHFPRRSRRESCACFRHESRSSNRGERRLPVSCLGQAGISQKSIKFLFTRFDGSAIGL
jgi:hypothetical protein